MDKEILENLTAAVSNGRTDIVRTLVNLYETQIKEKGLQLSINQILSLPCNSMGTLLHLATKLDHTDIVRTLLCSGADPNVQNALGETPYDLIQSQNMTSVYVDELLKCSAKSELARIHQLINAGVDINAPDSPESGNRALHWAVCYGKQEAVQCLLDLGAFPNVINGQGATPLHDAVKRKNMEIIRTLLKARADPNFKSLTGKYFGETPLDLAKGNRPITDLLLEYIPVDNESESASNSHPSSDNAAETVDKELSESLQSLSTSSELAANTNFSFSVPQPVNFPSFSPLPLITDSKLHLLWPQPQKIIQTDGSFLKFEEKYSVHIVTDAVESTTSIVNVWDLHAENFALFGVECSVQDIVDPNSFHGTHLIICHVNNYLFPKKETYKLIINNEQIRIIASDVLGLHYALSTLGQLFSLYHEDCELPSLFIHDWPQLQHRAVLLDFTLGARKPSMETLKGCIKTMSFLKLKQLHCCFRYESGHTEEKFPFSKKEFIEFTSYCQAYHISLIPAIDVEPLANYLDLKRSLSKRIHHLMALFSSKDLQIGPILSQILLNEVVIRKNPKLIWEVLLLLPPSIIYLCISSIQQSTELVNLLPVNCILIDYAYQVEYDYDINAKRYSLSGFNVCIGTGSKSWGSIAGCPESAIECIYKGAVVASLNGSFGLIVADWKTTPHHPAFSFSWPGIVLALGLAWNCTMHKDYLHARLSELLNFYVYRDMAQITGYLNVELGRLEAFMHQSIYHSRKENMLQPLTACQSSVTHQLLTDPDAVLLDNFTFDLLQQVIRHLKKFELELQKAKPTCFQHGVVISELRLAIDLLMFACRLSKVMISTGVNPTSNSCGLAIINVGISNLPPIARTDLANRLLALTEQFRAVWLSRNLPCGLDTSLCLFNTILFKLIPENEHSLYSINGNVERSNNQIQFM